MCSVKTPKPAPAPKEKEPQYLRNPWLDGMSMTRSTLGRNALRVDPGSPVQPLTSPTLNLPAAPKPVTPNYGLPAMGGGGGGGASMGGGTTKSGNGVRQQAR